MKFVESIISGKGIDKNFKLMVLEVTKQVEDTSKVIEKPNSKLVSKIDARDDYIDNLKSVIENKCFYVNLKHELDKKGLDVIRAVNIIGSNLEHLADHAVGIVSQVSHLKSLNQLTRFKCKLFFDEILTGLSLITKAFFNQDISLALKICRTEFNTDVLFDKNLKLIIENLEKGKNAGDLITILFVLNYLERMGDTILNIGEAIIFSIIGEKLKIHDYEALEDSMSCHNMKNEISNLEIQSYWETKSGCKISRVKDETRTDNESRVIFKEGRIKKLEKERESILLWENIQPGLPPKVYSFHKNGNKASILLEYLDGQTLLQIILDSHKGLLNDALAGIRKTLSNIWTKTKKDEGVNAGFISQLQSRLDDIFKVHPEFEIPEKRIGSKEIFSLNTLINQAQRIEKELKAPFSVHVHGDFNIDNILFNRNTQSIHFIDLYRSVDQDYVQDLSVFLVSNFRQPVFELSIRERLNQTIDYLYNFGLNFSKKYNDSTFQARLALGLARSLFTSTRFEVDNYFAEAMKMRSIYLLEKLNDHKGNLWEDFILPNEILYF